MNLTKDGFTKMWTIKLVSTDFDKIMKDYEYIKARYKKLLIIKTREEIIEEKKQENSKKWFFQKLKDLIP